MKVSMPLKRKLVQCAVRLYKNAPHAGTFDWSAAPHEHNGPLPVQQRTRAPRS